MGDRRLNLSDEERERRSRAMRELNANGKSGRRHRRTDDERIRASLMKVVQTGTPRQRLDATRQLAALNERSTVPSSRDFDRMTDSEIEEHFERLARRTMDHWAADRLVPQLGELFERHGMGHVFERVVSAGQRGASWAPGHMKPRGQAPE